MPKKKIDSEMKTAENSISKLTTEKELEDFMSENNCASEKVIADYIEELRAMEPSPEEVKLKERYESELSALETRNKEIDKKIRKITDGAYAGILSGSEHQECQILRNEKQHIKNKINNLEWEIRSISKNRMLNDKAMQEYERSLNECRAQIERLKKSKAHFDECGEKEAFEKASAELFNEKKKLREIESEKPQRLDERTEIEIKGAEIRDMIRKAFLARTIYYLERIAECAQYSQDAEMLCLSIEENKGWRNFHGKPSALDTSYFISSFYAGVAWRIKDLNLIADQIENY